MHPNHEDRCVGCLPGVACGDILGAAVEGCAASEIRQEYGELRDFQDAGRGFGCYTDDTQMTLALASSLRAAQVLRRCRVVGLGHLACEQLDVLVRNQERFVGDVDREVAEELAVLLGPNELNRLPAQTTLTKVSSLFTREFLARACVADYFCIRSSMASPMALPMRLNQIALPR
jgi:hypothetical protein